MQQKSLIINGVNKRLIVDPEASLADVIRRQLGLTGTKVGCDSGHCGSCAVIMNANIAIACAIPMRKVADGTEITTIEGIGTPDKPHPLQVALMVYGAPQCGFCMPGFVVAGKALLDQNPAPTREQVRNWFHKYRNACRCNGYKPIVDAVMAPPPLLPPQLSQAIKFLIRYPST